MEKIICPSCGAEVAVDGSAIYTKSEKLDESVTLHKRIDVLTAKIEKLSKEHEDNDEDEDEGQPFSEFER